MQKIPLNLATAGMVLARDVFRNGNTASFPVCGKKTLLTEEIITRLNNMDIASIYVEGRPLWQEGDPSPEEMLSALEHRFKKVRQDPLMAKLHDIFADYYNRSMGGNSDRQA